MPNCTHIMLDLETMSTQPNAAIIAIGAVQFDQQYEQIGKTFYQNVYLSSSQAAGLHICADTVTWWLDQSHEARKSLGSNPVGLNIALQRFNEWVLQATKDPYSLRVWGNGANFDNVIISQACRAVKLQLPWKYWQDRCYRTFAAQYGIPKLEGVAHHALEDARRQAQAMVNTCKQHNISLE